MNSEYQKALEKFRAASVKWRKCQAAYRAALINDADYLNGRRQFETADAEMDTAEEAKNDENKI